MNLAENVCKTLIRASTCMGEKELASMQKAYASESNDKARWALKLMLDNQEVARRKEFPLCSDTGVPHILLSIGNRATIPFNFWDDIYDGVAEGMRRLPANPVAVKGDDMQRLTQTAGLYDDPGKLLPPGLHVTKREGETIQLTVLMLGGGAEMRSEFFKVEHRQSSRRVISAIIERINDMPRLLGCTPCIPAVGIGRSFYEAAVMMLEAMAYSQIDEHEIAKEITEQINNSGTGPLGLGGDTTALGTLIKIGPTKSSSMRFICVRLLCYIEPRRASFVLG